MSDLPVDIKEGCRYHKTPNNLRVHATSVENLQDIIKDGLLPRCETGCFVWGAECIPYNVRQKGSESEVLECREENIYFWDDYAEGAIQGLGTVGYVGSGNPAVLIVDVTGMELRPDVEIEFYERDEEDCDPHAEMVEGAVEPERIKCICKPR